MKVSALIVGLGLLLAGCQTGHSIDKHAGLDNAGFMSLWDTYSYCKIGTDLTAMHTAAQRLNQLAYRPAIVNASDSPLPKAIQRWVSEPPARLAVDPKAMAAACSVHTGQVALSVGRHDLADEMFRSVLQYPAITSPYYIEQARAGLAQVSSSDQAAIESPVQIPRVVALTVEPFAK
ncbi:MAG: hypothetical protein ACREJU_20080 [Nitrospiraceae bacterium]